MDLLEQITKEIEALEHERNDEMCEAWESNGTGIAFEKSEKIRKKYESKIRFLENMKSMQESVINDFNYYKEKLNK